MFKKLFFDSYYKDVVLMDEVLINIDRKELKSGKLIADKDVNFISVGVAPPFEAFGVKYGIRTSAGHIVNPEIILLDANGVEYPLVHAGARRFKGYEYANYEYEGDIPKGKAFEKVTLRSEVPILATRIQWSGYDIKDLP